MIRITCPSCQSKLNAKDELLGQTRSCPKCGQSILIRHPPAEPPARAETTVPLVTPSADERADWRPRETLATPPIPDRLDRLHHYWICDRKKVIATWENNGQGWRIRSEHGFLSAARNPDKIPAQGDFRLVELKMGDNQGQLHLHGLCVYQLAQRWALVSIARAEDGILQSVTGLGGLVREQKAGIRQYLGERFMREVWQDARVVLDYLGNTDYHSPGAG